MNNMEDMMREMLTPMDLLVINFALTKAIDDTKDEIVNNIDEDEKVSYILENQGIKETLRKIELLQLKLKNKNEEEKS